MDNKENKNTKYRNVTNNRMIGEIESIFNSTAKNPSDFILNDADISTIAAIGGGGPVSNFDFNNEIVMTAENYKSNGSKEVIAGTDLLAKQVEIDSLYLQYLMITTMNERFKKRFSDEEEIMMKDALELFKANETLKKQCSEIEYEESIIDSLLELVEFIDAINKWIDTNFDELCKFEANYQSLAEICGKAKNFLKITNIHRPQNFDFEETVASELKKTFQIIHQINNIFNSIDWTSPPSEAFAEKIDLKLIEELKNQNAKLKDGIIKYNGLNINS